VFLMHNSRSRLLASRWGGQHEAARGVIAGSERVQDLKADSIRNCDDVAVGRTLNYFGALAFVTHLSAVVVYDRAVVNCMPSKSLLIMCSCDSTALAWCKRHIRDSQISSCPATQAP